MSDGTLRQQIDEVTRLYKQRYGAFERKLQEYNDAQTEERRLIARAAHLEMQLSEAKDQITTQKQTIQTIESDITPHLRFFQAAATSTNDTFSAMPTIEPTIGTPTQQAPTPTNATQTTTRTSISATQLQEHTPLSAPDEQLTVSTSSLGNKVLTDAVAREVIEDIRKLHNHEFSMGEIKAIVEYYPHARLKDGQLYLRKCSDCGANASKKWKENGETHYFTGNMALVRHMRGHGYASGINSHNIDDHCILSGPVSFNDLLLMSQGRDPNVIDVMVTARHDRKSTDPRDTIVRQDGAEPSQVTESEPMLSNGAMDSSNVANVELGVFDIKQEEVMGSKRNSANDSFQDEMQDLPRKRIRKSNPKYGADFVLINAWAGPDDDDDWTV